MCTPRDMFNVYRWIACTQKLIRWSKWVFTHSCTQEVIPLHFLSTAWMCSTLYSAVRSIWIDWPLTFCSCSLWCKFWTEWDVAKGYYFLRIHTCPLHQCGAILGHSLASGHSVPCDYLKDDIFSGPSSVVNMGEWLQDTGQFLSVSTLPAARFLLVSFFPRLQPRRRFLFYRREPLIQTQFSYILHQQNGFRCVLSQTAAIFIKHCFSQQLDSNSISSPLKRTGRVRTWIWVHCSDLCFRSWSICKRCCFPKLKREGRMEIPLAPWPLAATLSAAHHRRLVYQA